MKAQKRNSYLLTGLACVLVFLLGACARQEGDQVAWYEMVAVTGELLPVVRDDTEFLDGWMEVHSDTDAVWRMTLRKVSGKGDGPLRVWAACGPLIRVGNEGEPDSVSFTYRFYLEIPGVVSGWSRIAQHGTYAHGLFTLRHHDEPSVFMFKEGSWDHPEIVEVYDLASVRGETLPTRMDGGRLLAGRLQVYSDRTWTFVRQLEEGEMRPDTTGALPVPFAGRLEVVEEVGAESHLLFSFHDPTGKPDSMPGLLSGTILTLVVHDDSFVFNKRL